MKKIVHIIFFVSIALSGYGVGDTISEADLNIEFDTCFGDLETISFGDYQNSSVIWINLSASWWTSCYNVLLEGDEVYLDWKDDSRVQTFISLDELGAPWTCQQWADNTFSGGLYEDDGTTPASPQIIDDGNSPEKVIWNWFDYALSAQYPKNIFIDHDMKIHAITEIDMTSEAVNEIINQMLSNAPSGCTDDTACNYDSNAFNDDGSCDLPLEGCDCDSVDTDSDGICNEIDICPDTSDPYQHDRDQDGLGDACDDNDDDGDGLLDCWDYWYDDGIQMSVAEIEAAIESGSCQDFALGHSKDFLPSTIDLFSVFPNPFNPSSIITFNLSYPQIVDIDIYDINGQKLIDLTNKFYNSGSHNVEWKPEVSISSGLYIVHFQTLNFQASQKVLYLK